ncbi:MAG: Nif3-like dinuclear metal center hexameric protein [Ignavibacteria bacterium]|nr:Nif3-like dinuclear metal center hexameric protein [Ignavibacteria bacterium]
MNIHQFVQLIHTALPPETAMKGDRLGLQVQSGRTEISSILVTLEITEEVITEALHKGNDCIVTFHPLIFSPLISLQENDRVGRLCTSLIKHEIAVIAVHTNFDAFPTGTSAIIAEDLGLIIERVLVPDRTYNGSGIGVVARTILPISLQGLVTLIWEKCGSPVRYTTGNNKEINRIAIVGGSGTSFIDDAIESGADAFITADVKYHTFHRAKGEIALIDPGHYEMERYVPQGLASLIKQILPLGEDISVSVSTTITNPVQYCFS